MKKQITLIILILVLSIAASLGAARKYKYIGGIRFVYIPGGTFYMGSAKGLGYFNERPRQKVTLKGFWISEHEVTQRIYASLMKKNPSTFVKRGPYPVETVNWYDAIHFCEKFSAKYKVSARLPYEREWEYAARAGTSTLYYWGNRMNNRYAWYNMTANDDLHPVKSKRPNRWGLYGMSGNVAEWCQDWYSDAYVLPNGPDSGISKVVRGGSWCDDEYNLRSAFRTPYDPHSRYFNIGFRVVIDE